MPATSCSSQGEEGHSSGPHVTSTPLRAALPRNRCPRNTAGAWNALRTGSVTGAPANRGKGQWKREAGEPFQSPHPCLPHHGEDTMVGAGLFSGVERQGPMFRPGLPVGKFKRNQGGTSCCNGGTEREGMGRKEGQVLDRRRQDSLLRCCPAPPLATTPPRPWLLPPVAAGGAEFNSYLLD